MNTTVASTAKLVRNRVEATPLGEPFSCTELLTLGTRAAIDYTLSRLTKAGVIARITRGVYIRPIMNKYVGQVTPEPFKIAQAVARGTGAQVSMNGAEAGMALSALYYLGRDEVTTTVIEKIKAKLAPAEFEQLRRSTGLMPSWMCDLFYQNESNQIQDSIVA